MEEAKTSLPPPPPSPQPPLSINKFSQSQIKPVQIEPSHQKPTLTSQKLSTINFTTIETQTNAAKVDLATQTSLETVKSTDSNNPKTEIPTRDSQGSESRSIARKMSRLVSSSPKKSILTAKVPQNNPQSDLTKVSTIISPSSSSSSSSSSLLSASFTIMTNVTSRAASPVYVSKEKEQEAKVFTMTKKPSDLVVKQSSATITVSNDEEKYNLFESDEILKNAVQKNKLLSDEIKVGCLHYVKIGVEKISN